MYRFNNIYGQASDFFKEIGLWFWDTAGFIVDIILEFLGRSIELALAILYLVFQIVCFLREMCIEALQTFGNIFRGVVHLVGSIDSEDIEDFATACIVVLLWVIAGKFVLSTLEKNTGPYNPLNLFSRSARRKSSERLDQPAISDSTWNRPAPRNKMWKKKKKSS